MSVTGWTPVQEDTSNLWKPVNEGPTKEALSQDYTQNPRVPKPLIPQQLQTGNMSGGGGRGGAYGLEAPYIAEKGLEAGKAFLGLDQPPPPPPTRADVLGESIIGPGYDVVKGSMAASNQGLATMQKPGITNKLSGAAEYVLGGIPIAGPQIVNAMEGKDIPTQLGRTAQIVAPMFLGGETETPRLTTAADIEQIGNTPQALARTAGNEGIMKSLRPAAKLGDTQAEKFGANLSAAESDISQLAREHPLQSKGPQRFMEAAENFQNQADTIRKENIEPLEQQFGHLPVNMDAVRQAAQKAITNSGADPAGTRAAMRWVNGLGEKNVSDAVTLRMDLNKMVKEQFGKLTGPAMEARKAAVMELRNQIDAALESTGNPGIKDANRRAGALDAMADRLQQLGRSGLNQKEMESSIPKAIRVYMFVTGHGVHPGLSVNPEQLFTKPLENKFTEGYNQLGKAGMAPNMFEKAQPRLIAAPDTSGNIPNNYPKNWQDLPSPNFPRNAGTGIAEETRPVRGADLSDVPLSRETGLKQGGVIRRQPFAPPSRGLALPPGPRQLGLPDLGGTSTPMERESPLHGTSPIRPIELGEGGSTSQVRQDENGNSYYTQRDAKTGRMTKVYAVEPTRNQAITGKGTSGVGKVASPADPQALADSMGVKFNGIQDAGGTGMENYAVFNDKQGGSIEIPLSKLTPEELKSQIKENRARNRRQ